MTRFAMIGHLALLALLACKGDDVDVDTGAVDDTDTQVDTDTDTDSDTDTDTDSDTDTDTDTGPVPTAASGSAFCASGGPVEGNGVQGTMCLSPLELTGKTSTDGTHTWTPGPIGRITP